MRQVLQGTKNANPMGLLGSWCSPTVTGAASGSHGYVLHEQQEQKGMFWEDKGDNRITVPPAIPTDALVGCGISAVL